MTSTRIMKIIWSNQVMRRVRLLRRQISMSRLPICWEVASRGPLWNKSIVMLRIYQIVSMRAFSHIRTGCTTCRLFHLKTIQICRWTTLVWKAVANLRLTQLILQVIRSIQLFRTYLTPTPWWALSPVKSFTFSLCSNFLTKSTISKFKRWRKESVSIRWN